MRKRSLVTKRTSPRPGAICFGMILALYGLAGFVEGFLVTAVGRVFILNGDEFELAEVPRDLTGPVWLSSGVAAIMIGVRLIALARILRWLMFVGGWIRDLAVYLNHLVLSLCRASGPRPRLW